MWKIILSAFFLFPSLSQANVTEGLVGYYKLDETSGNAIDSSGNGNTGTATGATGFGSSDCKRTSCRNFVAASSQYITVPFSSTLQPTAAITFAGWFYAYNKGADQKLISMTQAGGYSFGTAINFLTCSSTDICAAVNVGGTYQLVPYPLSNFNNNQWYHFAATYNGTTLIMYINGVNVGSTSASGTISYTVSNPLCIGSEPDNTVCNTGEYWDGRLDDIRVYNRALTAQEVLDLYNVPVTLNNINLNNTNFNP